MDTVIETDVSEAQRFLKWRFGSEFDGKVYFFGLRIRSDGEKIKSHRCYNNIKQVDDEWWDSQCHKFNVTYSTSTVKESGYDAKNASNTKQITDLWFDIDAPKKMRTGDKEIIVSGAEFFNEIRVQDDFVSGWVRSSEHGIQGYVKLAEPIEIDGDKERFDTHIAPILHDLAWHYGADPAVVHLGALMRLPGTLNVKREYTSKFLVLSELHEGREHSLEDIKKRYAPDFDAVPQIYAYAFLKLMGDTWTAGERHEASLQLAGSARKMGLDRASTKRLHTYLQKKLGGDIGQVLTNVDTTYDRDFDEISTLYVNDSNIASGADSIFKEWLTLKKTYAKKRGFDFQPETDPTKPRTVGDMAFAVVDGETFYRDDKGATKKVANFSIQILRRVRKFADKSITWVAELTKGQSDPVTMEIPTALHNSWAKFSTIKPHVAGIGFEPAALWTSYIMQLDEESRETPLVIETPYYGVIGADTGNPILFLPGEDRSDFVLPPDAHKFDTAMPGALTKETTKKERVEYLEGFADFYPGYHDDSYAISALGWFCGCPIAAFLRTTLEGFPTLMVSGLKGAGKSTIITQVISHHFGCAKAKSFNQGGTTPFTIKRRLGSNNIVPYVGDEFKDEVQSRTEQIQGLINALWNCYDTESGLASGDIRTDHLQAPMAIIGEHTYNDEATLDRTFLIRVTPDFVKGLRDAGIKAQRKHEKANNWLQENRHAGMLGSLLLDYVGRHIEEVAEIISAAKDLVEKTCEVRNERKRQGYIGVFSGLFLLRQVCRENGVTFPWRNTEMVAAVYDADPDVREKRQPGGGTMKTLFAATDQAIVDGIRKHAPYFGLTYAFAASNPDVVYIQLSRWLDMVTPFLKGAYSAALKNAVSFEDLIYEHLKEQDTPIIDIQEGGFFVAQNVVIDVKKIQEMYKIDTQIWRKMDDVEE